MMADETFDHALVTLLGYGTKSHPYRALRNSMITSVYQIAGLLDEDLEDMKADEWDENDKVKMSNQSLPQYAKSGIRIMGNFVRYLIDEVGDIVKTDKGFINAATRESWITFRVAPDKAIAYYGNFGQGPNTPNSIGSNNNNVVTPSPQQASPTDLIFQSFLRGAKCDKKDYDVLKDERQYDNWQRSFLAQARAHHIDRVLKPDFTPIDENDAAMFKLQQQFTYTVLDATLKTDMGKTIVRKHQFTGNAQAVWNEFTSYMKKSTRAKYSSSKLLTYLTTSRYDRTWKGSVQGYVLYWLARAQEYDAMISDPNSRLNDQQKKTLLQNAVNDTAELRQVRINFDIIEAGDPDESISYQQYVNLLISTAENIDNHTSDSGKKNQQVYVNDINNNDSDFTDIVDDESYNIDTYLTHVMNRNTPIQSRKPRVNNTNFSGNSTSTSSDSYPFNVIPRESWLKIPADVRADLTALRKSNSSSNTTNLNRNANSTILEQQLFEASINDNNQDNSNISVSDILSNDGDTSLIDYTLNKTQINDNDIQQIVQANVTKRFTSGGRKSNDSSVSSTNDITVNGVVYTRKINFTCIEYKINTKTISVDGYSLIDRGANGGLLGNDVRVLEKSNRLISITGIDKHQVRDLPICTAAGYGYTNKGHAIFILNQYAYLGHGKTIHSSAQMEAFKIIVDDKSRTLGGTQRLTTPDGYLIPLDFIGGLAYIKLRPPSDKELEELPHIILTSDVDWDPTCIDNTTDISSENWYTEKDVKENYGHHPFNKVGEYKGGIVMELMSYAPNDFIVHRLQWEVNEHNSRQSKPDYVKLQPYFGWCSPEIISKTFDNTTQYIRCLHNYGNMRKHYKSRFPAFNIFRRNEPVATDTVMSDTPSIGCGSKCAQIFVGRESLVTDVYGMKTDKEFVTTLEDNIRRRGAMEKLISDRALAEIGSKVHDILRALFIDDWQSEPHHQHQNFAELHYSTIKTRTNVLMNRTGAPANAWLYCLKYICFVFNHVSSKILDWRTPLTVLTGETTDISILMLFTFWEDVFYSTTDTSFPSESTEESGNFIGFSEHVGDMMTFIVLSKSTKRILYRSNVCSANDTTRPNNRISTDGEVDDYTKDKQVDCMFIQSKYDNFDDAPTHRLRNMAGYTPKDLIGRTFLDLPAEDGTKYTLRIIKAIAENLAQLDQQPEKVKFLAESTTGGYEKILAYNEILNYLDDDNTENGELTKFKDITAHQGPLTANDKNYKGSRYNVLVEWEDGDVTFEPLDVIAADDPVTCAVYAKRHNLLDTPGWRRFKRLARENTPKRIGVYSSVQSFHRKAVRFKYGYQVPGNHREAMVLDGKNGNDLWKEAEKAEIEALNNYDTFVDIGKGVYPTSEFTKIRCHMVYDVKHDGRHRSRLVAGGHLTPVPDDSTYSGVISLRALRFIVFLAELNSLKLWGADVSSAYLEAVTKEKVFFIAGDEFGDKAGNTMVINKALYGLRTSGLRWHEKFSDILRDLGFWQCRGEPDI
jgi:Reverse transcriptase (RNA-dependent DNA polymerase)